MSLNKASSLSLLSAGMSHKIQVIANRSVTSISQPDIGSQVF